VAERLSVIALDNLDKLACRARALLQANRALLEDFFRSRDRIEVVWPEYGTVAFPRLKQGTVERLYSVCREKYETSFVPGSFFAMAEGLRVGIGVETSMLREALVRLGRALEEFVS
jgi:aspartate/methionine/tyrosine aminotransferase